MNPATLSDRKAWKPAAFTVSRAFPGAKDALLGRFYSQSAYVPKTNEPTDTSIVVYKTQWPGYSAGRGGYLHYGWEAWINGQYIASADTMREAISKVNNAIEEMNK